jgi:predicted alternative tryptophan synthase beta-subunit
MPAPESCPAISAVDDEALACKQSGEAKTLLFNLSGHGHFDMTSYDKYLAGELHDYSLPQEVIDESLSHLHGPTIPE